MADEQGPAEARREPRKEVDEARKEVREEIRRGVENARNSGSMNPVAVPADLMGCLFPSSAV